MAASKKTPYQGGNRCQGDFQCNKGHRWPSAFSWANCGQRCAVCTTERFGKTDVSKKELEEIPYTYPYSQTPLQEVWLYCDKCNREEEGWYPKSKKCTTVDCTGRLEPWNFLECPSCQYMHEWAEDHKTARKYEFVCKEHCEPGYGCDEVISINKCREQKKTGPHRQSGCEKCDQLGHRCSRHGKARKKAKRAVGDTSKVSVGVDVNNNNDINNNDNNNNSEVNDTASPLSSAKRKARRNKPRRQSAQPRSGGDAAVHELCQILDKL